MSELKVNKITPSTGTQVELGATTTAVTGTMTAGTVNGPTGLVLQHVGSTKLETTTTGVRVTGTVEATAFSGSGAGLTGIVAAGTGGTSSTGSLSVIAASGGGGVGQIDFYTNGTAGANVRGTVTNGGDWNFDSGTLFVQAATNRVGIGNTSPSAALDVSGTIIASSLTLRDAQIVGGFGAESTTGVTNWNDTSNARAGNGFTLLQSTATNGPTSLTGSPEYFHPFSFEYDTKDGSGNLTQLAFPYVNPNAGVHVRTRNNGTWGSWWSMVTQPNSATPGITVTANGVGINNTAPNAAYKLDVTGAGHVSGLLTIDNGLKFPQTAVASTDANVLDDYEEGTWTPAYGMVGGSATIGTVTYDTANTSGTYVKIGKQVYVQGRIKVTTGASSASGTYGAIVGLPFTASGFHSINISFRSGTWGTNKPAAGYTYGAGIYLLTSAWAYLGPTDMGAATPPLTSTEIIFSCTYIATT